jgi:hypothetical protein
MPTGGTAGQIIIKNSSTDYDVSWSDNIAYNIETYVKNATGSTLPKGSVVYIAGADSSANVVTVELADADTEATSSKTYGILKQDLTTGSFGYVVNEGTVEGLDTSAATVGQSVWLSSTAGGFVFGSPPAKPAHAVYLGVVSRSQSNNGKIQVKVQNGYELEELHNVVIDTPADNEVLAYDSTSSVWKNQTATEAGLVAEGDSRLTNARTPTAHASTHASGGSDPVTLAQSQITNLTTDLAAKAPLTGVGLVPIIPSSVSVGVGSASVDSAGLVTFTSVDYVQLNDVFTTDYRNYVVIFERTSGSTTDSFNVQLVSGTTPSTASVYDITRIYTVNNTAPATSQVLATTNFGASVTVSSTAGYHATTMEFFAPKLVRPTGAKWTSVQWVSAAGVTMSQGVGYHRNSTSYEGIRLVRASTSTSSGTVKVYGYN